MSDHTIVIIWVMKLFFVQFFCVFLPPLLNSFCCFFYEDLQDLLEVTPKKDVLFIIGDWNAKVGSQETPGVRQIWPWNEEWSRAKTNRVLPRKCTGHSKHPLPTQEMTLCMDITNGQYQNQIDYILCSWRWRSSIQSEKTRMGADCGSDHEHLFAKFRLKLKKVGKTTRPFRYDLGQIPYDYTVEVTNRFKGLDLIHRLSEQLWTKVCNIL